MKRTLVILLGLAAYLSASAQDEETLDDLFGSNYETPQTIELADQDEDEDEYAKDEDTAGKQRKKKKVNPKIYYGIKTKKGFAKHGFGASVVVELFHYLKEKDYVGPDQYDREFYWYDFKKKKLSRSTNVRKDYAGVLHGHYVKKLGDQVLEEGYFYKGKKHGRWVRYNRHDILQEKEVYWKGHKVQSRMAYYDFEKTKVKEIIPIHYGEKQGEYLAFHENGNLAAVGQYHFDHKVGIWREYYANGKIKRELKYPLEPFDFKSPSVILKEWDKEGHIIYDRSRFEARL